MSQWNVISLNLIVSYNGTKKYEIVNLTMSNKLVLLH